MSIALAHDHDYYLLRSRKGVQRLGAAWPDTAVVSYKNDRYALIYPEDFTVRRGVHLEDALREAERSVSCEGKSHATVARVVGRYDQANVYQPVVSFYDTEKATAEDATRKRYLPPKDSAVLDGRFEFKQLGETTGKPVVIQGFASTPDIDRDYDTIHPDAFKEDIKAFLDNPVLLFNHAMFAPPIGGVKELDFRPEGLWVVAEVDDDQVKQWVLKGRLRTFSVTFVTKGRNFIEAELSSSGDVIKPAVREITRAELVEVSVVTVPANAAARFEVVKSVKSMDPDADVGGCSIDGHTCVCDLPASIVDYRAFPVADPSEGWVSSLADISSKFGAEAARLCCTFESKSGPQIQHSAIVGDELKTVPALVRVAMAQVVARDHDMTDAQRQMAWSAIGKRWMECFPEEPVPTIDKYPAPGEFAKIAHLVGVGSDGNVIDSKSVRRWCNEHGLEVKSISESGGSVSAWAENPGRDTDYAAVDLGSGLRGRIAMKSPVTVKHNGKEQEEDMGMSKEEVASIAANAAKEAVKEALQESKGEPSSESKKEENTSEGGASESEQDEEFLIFDDEEEVEIELDHVQAIEARREGRPVDNEVLRQAIASGEAIFGSPSDDEDDDSS